MKDIASPRHPEVCLPGAGRIPGYWIKPINEILTKRNYKDVKEFDYELLIISGF
ncbi:MAG: hypothetical protein VB110_08440 [Bacteroidales bacterium]|nr:hypothetical protein [Bacteroidales bacterium]